MTRRSSDQTRALLLDTAVQLLDEKGTAAGVLHVRLADVVKRAGLTTGAAYRLWADQEDFHRDLAVAAIAGQGRTMLEVTTAAAMAVLSAGGSVAELLRAGSAASVRAMSDGPGGRTTLALRAAAYNQPALLHATTERAAELHTGFHHLYQELLRRFGMQMRPPFTLDHLSEAMSALADGFGLSVATGQSHPQLCLDGQEWTLMGVCVEALVRRMTEPIPGPIPGPIPPRAPMGIDQGPSGAE